MRTTLIKAYLRWPNTVIVRALANAIQHAQKDYKKQTWRRYRDYFYLLHAGDICAIFLHKLHSVLQLLVFCQKGMLEKWRCKGPNKFSGFSLLRKEPSKMQRMHNNYKENNRDCCTGFLGNKPISREPRVRISWKLARSTLENKLVDYQKSLKFNSPVVLQQRIIRFYANEQNPILKGWVYPLMLPWQRHIR